MVEGAFERRPEPGKLEPLKPKEDEQSRTQSQSLRNIVMKRIDDFSMATTNTKKVMILDGLITFCTNFIKDPKIREEVRATMKGRELNLHNDFLHVYKAEAEDNGWDIILEVEYKKILPFVREVWYTVEGELSKQGLLPWAFPDPRQELRDRMFRRTLKAIEKFNPAESESEKEPQTEEPAEAPEVKEEDTPPWVENKIPDPKEEREKKLRSLLEDPALEEEEDKEESDEDSQESLEKREIEEAERIWGRDTLTDSVRRTLDKRGDRDFD